MYEALLATPLDGKIELMVGRVKAEEYARGESIPRSWAVSKHTDSEPPCQEQIVVVVVD